MGLIDDILKKYPKDVKVVLKNFPLSFHKQAMKAARYVLAADRQGRDNYLKMLINRGLDLQNCEKDIYKKYRGRWSKKN